MKNRTDIRQLHLEFEVDEGFLKASFEQALGKAVHIAVTDNTSSMLSVGNKGETVCVRLHRMFLRAGDAVLSEVAEFIKRRRCRTPLIRAFISDNRGLLTAKPGRRPKGCKPGRFHDLQDIYESVNREYFDERVGAMITWGAKRAGRSVRKRTLGSYSRHNDVIRINPLLDRKAVPRYFVEFIVYHEMLHAVMEVEEKNNRRYVHCRAFKQRERLFRHYDKAMEWEKRNGI